MRTPRYWGNILILPEADIALGPLPLPGVEVKVYDGRHVSVSGNNYCYHFRALRYRSMDDAVDWLNQDFTQRGYNDVQWLGQDSSRIFVAYDYDAKIPSPSARAGLVFRAESEDDDGTITVIENQDVTISKKEDVKLTVDNLIAAAKLWLPRSIKWPDDAIVHASLHSPNLGLWFELPAGTVPGHYAFGMIQTERIGRYGYCRFIADGIIARNGDETRFLAEELANDPGVQDASVRMIDSEVVEVKGRIIDKRKEESTLRCRMIPAEVGAGLLVASLTLSGEGCKEAKKLMASVTETVETRTSTPPPLPEDIPKNAADALEIIDSFRQRLNPEEIRVLT